MDGRCPRRHTDRGVIQLHSRRPRRAGQGLGLQAAVQSCVDRPFDEVHGKVRPSDEVHGKVRPQSLSLRTVVSLNVLRLFCLKEIQDIKV